jgi:hypothetical protein
MRRLCTCVLSTLFAAGCGAPATPLDGGAGDLAVAPPADLSTVDLTPASMCTAAVQQLLNPIDMVSNGTVNILATNAGVRTVYIDASAGGINGANTNPRLYISLETATRVQLTDKTARKSTAWDLALKRVVLFTNDGDGGSGMGGALSVAKPFDQVTAADAAGGFTPESFVDGSCNPKTDPIGEVLTSMSSWYDYDQQTNHVTPKAGTTIIVRGGTGKLYKLEIDDYYSAPDGTMGMSGGHYKVRIGAL